MTTLKQPQDVFQVFHYLDKTLNKFKDDPRINLNQDLAAWGNFFAPHVQLFLQNDVCPCLIALQQKLDTPAACAVIEYSLLSLQMIVEENDDAHDAITDQLDDIWYNGMGQSGVEIHNNTLGSLLSELCGVVYDARKQQSTLSF